MGVHDGTKQRTAKSGKAPKNPQVGARSARSATPMVRAAVRTTTNTNPVNGGFDNDRRRDVDKRHQVSVELVAVSEAVLPPPPPRTGNLSRHFVVRKEIVRAVGTHRIGKLANHCDCNEDKNAGDDGNR